MFAYIFSEITRKRKLPIYFLEATGAFPLKNTTSQTAKLHNPTDNFLASQYNKLCELRKEVVALQLEVPCRMVGSTETEQLRIWS